MKKIFKRQVRIKPYAIIVFLIGVMLMSVSLYFLPSFYEETKFFDNSAYSIISGLKPDETVNYSVISNNAILARGTDKAGKKGDFKVPLFADNLENKALGYNLNIGQGDKALHLRMRKNKTDSTMRIYGRGLKKFSDVYVGKNKELTKTKSDWSGKIELEIENLNTKLNDDGSFQIALFQNGALGDIQKENPLTIRILDTEGGGTRDNGDVNYHEDPGNEACDRAVRLSVCEDAGTGDDWLNEQINEGVVNNYVAFLIMMQQQLTVGMIKYVELIGEFFDAKAQLETQRQFQVMTARAHKDYHPSKKMCEFGSFTKSLARVEENTKYVSEALNKTLMERYTNIDFTAGSEGVDVDIQTRLRQFRMTHCDPRDNNDGLEQMCQHLPTDVNPNGVGGDDPNRLNRDIDFTRLVYEPLTIGNVTGHVIDFIGGGETTEEEEDIIALARNLYWPRALDVLSNRGLEENPEIYMEARRIMAVYNVAHNSLTNIVALKASSPEFEDPMQSSGAFMKALMRELGFVDIDDATGTRMVGDEQIEVMLGAFPSYYAQMEVLTKKMYQTPNFYTHLYDKPANVNRIGVSLDAIKLMQMRDWYENALRQEMLMSLLVEQGLKKHVQMINQKLPVKATE